MSRQNVIQSYAENCRQGDDQPDRLSGTNREEHVALLSVVAQSLMDTRLEPVDARLLLAIGTDPTISIRALAERCRCQVKTARSGVERLTGTEYLASHRKMQGMRVVGTLYVVRGMRSTLPHQMELFGPHLPVKKKIPDSTGPVSGRNEGTSPSTMKQAAAVHTLKPIDLVRRRIQQAATKPGWSYAKAVPVIDAAVSRVGLTRVQEFAETLIRESRRPWEIERSLAALSETEKNIGEAAIPSASTPPANDARGLQVPLRERQEVGVSDHAIYATADLASEAAYILRVDCAVADMLRLKDAIERAGGVAPDDWRQKQRWTAGVMLALQAGTLERPTKWLRRIGVGRG